MKQRRLHGLVGWVLFGMFGIASSGMATIITSGTYGGDLGATNPITVQNPANCNGSGANHPGTPESNPYQVFAASNADPGQSGAQFLNLDFVADCGSTEYGINWQMNNLSGMAWHSMHFTLQFAPLENFSSDFDSPNFDSIPNNSIGMPMVGWTSTTIDFVGPSDAPNSSGVQFHIPLNMNGNCCSGNMLIIATPDFVIPEPSTIWLIWIAAAALVLVRIHKPALGMGKPVA